MTQLISPHCAIGDDTILPSPPQEWSSIFKPAGIFDGDDGALAAEFLRSLPIKD